MRKFFTRLGRFTTKLVSLLVICGFISLACLPIVHAAEGDENTDTATDLGDCQPATTDAGIATVDEGDGSGTTDDQQPTPTKYTVTIQHCDINNKRIAADKPSEHEAGDHTIIPDPIEGYDLPTEQPIHVNDNMLVTFVYQATVVDPGDDPITTATLTIHYEYTDHTEAATDHTEEVEIGTAYEVTSPVIEEYTPDQAVVKGTMVKGGVAVTVTYTKNAIDESTPTKYKITIQYQDTTENHTKIADDTTQECEANKQCTITPKDIDGYITPAGMTKVFTKDETVTFAYEKLAAKATLTIHYQYADKTKAADDYTGQIEVGKDYKVDSPAIANYTPDQLSVEGTMGKDGAAHTVTYTQNSPDKPTEYTITIYYKDADDKELSPSTTAVRTAGEHTFEAKEIAGYTKPASQTVNVAADMEITFKYKKISDADPEKPGDKPGTDDPKDPTDPGQKPSNQNPSDQKPADQQPGSQGSISLPTAGPSDAMIRDFLVLDAEISAGGIGLWAISGVIRKIRRH